jgi:hypothetical protein
LSVIVFDFVLVENEQAWALAAVEATAERQTAAKRVKRARFIGGKFLSELGAD